METSLSSTDKLNKHYSQIDEHTANRNYSTLHGMCNRSFDLPMELE